ncbi:MAG: cysQ [Daejeonella sp.]|nr:cysQ [Daejeonella sp.]
MEPNIEEILAIAVSAGHAIMTVYNNPEGVFVEYKNDNSPLTIADTLSNNIIVSALKALYPEIPVLSEEGADIPFEVRKDWEYYWCVDPLDGTKEFINRNGEFTVNIALIHSNKPVMGVIYIPYQDVLYYGNHLGAFKKIPGEEAKSIKVDQDATSWVSVGSRSHSDASEQNFLNRFPIKQQLTAGSSLKFCLIAEGKAHIYYRKGPTMEWDTAAGQAIAESSGAIFQTDKFEPFLYNKQSLLNGSFICRIAGDF